MLFFSHYISRRSYREIASRPPIYGQSVKIIDRNYDESEKFVKTFDCL